MYAVKICLMLKILYAGCLGLSVDFGEFTLGMCVTAWNREKLTKNPYFGGSRSLKVIDVGTPESLSAVLTMISNKSVSICNRSHARRANSSDITMPSRGIWAWIGMGSWQTDWTDIITIAHTHLALCAVARKNTKTLKTAWHKQQPN